jgi:hypothetical protein
MAKRKGTKGQTTIYKKMMFVKFNSNRTGVTHEAGTDEPPGGPEFIVVF